MSTLLSKSTQKPDEPKIFIIADGHVINYFLTWQTVSYTVFGFQFSVKNITHINKLAR